MSKIGLPHFSATVFIRLCYWTNYCKTCYGSDGKESACNVGDLGSIAGSEKIPWKRKWHPTPVLLPGKSHGQRSLVGYSPWGRKELDTTERLHFHFEHSLALPFFGIGMKADLFLCVSWCHFILMTGVPQRCSQVSLLKWGHIFAKKQGSWCFPYTMGPASPVVKLW